MHAEESVRFDGAALGNRGQLPGAVNIGVEQCEAAPMAVKVGLDRSLPTGEAGIGRSR
jgi:hypothetical protein